MKKNIMLLSISTLDKKECICREHKFNTHTQSYVICGVEYLLNIFYHEQDRHKSSESCDEVERVVRNSTNSCKETNIKRKSTKQTKISILIIISYISSCLNEISQLCTYLCSQIQECIIHVRVFALMNNILLICMRWVSSLWFCTTFHCYLSRMKPLC